MRARSARWASTGASTSAPTLSLFRGRAELHDLVGDASKARETLGWTPEVSFEELVAMLVEADLERLRGQEVTASS